MPHEVLSKSRDNKPLFAENGGRCTLEEACSVLESLRKNVMELLGGERLRVGLERMDIMRPDRGDASRAHVMYVGPISDSEDAKRLKAVGSTYTTSLITNVYLISLLGAIY